MANTEYSDKLDHFIDIGDQGIPPAIDPALGDWEDYLRSQMLDGGLLGDVFVNETGDTMTGALMITPTVDTTEMFQVNRADGTVIFNVDTTNGRIGFGTDAPSKLVDIYSKSDTEAIRIRGEADTGDMVDKIPTLEGGDTFDRWTGGISAVQTSDNVYLSNSYTFPDWVVWLRSFDLNIPVQLTITGIKVVAEAKSSQYTAGQDNRTLSFQLSKNNGSLGNGDIKTSAELTTVDTVFNFGGSTDLWGTTWESGDFIDGSFAVRMYSSGTFGITRVDLVTVTVYISGESYTEKLGDIFIGSGGEMIFDLTPGASTGQFFDFRPEDDEYGLVLRESDGTGIATYANFYVVDAADDYLAINVDSIQDTDALVVTAANKVGIGMLPTNKLDVAGVVGGDNFISDVTTGTQPYACTSTTLNTNLNAGLLDSQHGAYYLDSDNFTGTEWTGLTDGGDTTLHGHDHDGLTNFAANEHIDHTAVTLTAGVGLSGGGDISANRTFTVDLNELTTETGIAAGDFLAMVDITDSGSGKITFANLEAALDHNNLLNSHNLTTDIDHNALTNTHNLTTDIDHDQLTNFVADEHVAHTGVTITAGDGLSGGGDISVSRTIDLDHLGIENLADPGADRIMFWDDSETKTDWLTAGAGLNLTTTTLKGDLTTMDNWAALGDLIVGTANDTAAILTVGSNGQVLVADSGEATGLKWKAQDGWVEYEAVTPTRASADDPTYVLTFAGVDLTGFISVGMKITWVQNSTTRFGFVTAISFSTDTTLTLYGGTDYDVDDTASFAISTVKFSSARAPFGFPLEKSGWMVEFTDTTNREQATPTQNTWYNPGSLSIDIPIGAWDVTYGACLQGFETGGSDTIVHTTLSTTTNSKTDAELTCSVRVYAALLRLSVHNYQQIEITTKDTYYMLISTGSPALDHIRFANANQTMAIRAVCAYL